MAHLQRSSSPPAVGRNVKLRRVVHLQQVSRQPNCCRCARPQQLTEHTQDTPFPQLAAQRLLASVWPFYAGIAASLPALRREHFVRQSVTVCVPIIQRGIKYSQRIPFKAGQYQVDDLCLCALGQLLKRRAAEDAVAVRFACNERAVGRMAPIDRKDRQRVFLFSDTGYVPNELVVVYSDV
jgi:hypothetical protein